MMKSNNENVDVDVHSELRQNDEEVVEKYYWTRI
jgi:hypothetical protein